MDLNEDEDDALKLFNDLILCDYCGRKFEKIASEKHIPRCKENSYKNNFWLFVNAL